MPVLGLPEQCACGEAFTKDHAMICKKGGFISLRHNELRDITHDMMAEVCKGVESEPLLLPLTGEQLHYRTANKNDNARLDISARGFWTRGERAFFDIRVFDPKAPSHRVKDLKAAHRQQEGDKRREYQERIINVEHATFTPLVFTITGGMGQAAQKCYARLADMLADVRGMPRSLVVTWMRCRLSFSLLRSANLCLRGTRIKRPKLLDLQDTDFLRVVAEGRIAVHDL